jgi:nucleotide-binding universal stress UspA family protein
VTGRHCILSGIDLGPDTESVLSYAACFGAGTRAAVKLLYVIDYLLTPPSYLAAYIEEEKRREETEMSGWKARLKKEGIDAEYAIVLGRLHESFDKVIGETSPDLLVLGHRSHVIRPSSSERLIRSLKIPMVVVRGKAAEGAVIGSVEIKKILCPVDFSDNARRAVSAATRYAGIFGADLRLIHIIPSYLIKEKWGVWKEMGDADRKKFDASMHAEAESKLEALCRECGITAKGEVLQGNPSEVIAGLALAGKYDLVTVGGRGLSYIQSVLIGSTTEALLKSSPCPLLIVH